MASLQGECSTALRDDPATFLGEWDLGALEALGLCRRQCRLLKLEGWERGGGSGRERLLKRYRVAEMNGEHLCNSACQGNQLESL